MLCQYSRDGKPPDGDERREEACFRPHNTAIPKSVSLEKPSLEWHEEEHNYNNRSVPF